MCNNSFRLCMLHRRTFEVYISEIIQLIGKSYMQNIFFNGKEPAECKWHGQHFCPDIVYITMMKLFKFKCVLINWKQ